MFADKIGVSCSTVGAASYTLGSAYGTWRSWGQGFANGAACFYYATDDTGTRWEYGYGIYTSPATLTRTLLYSSSGALISWTGTYRIFSVPVGDVLADILNRGVGKTLPAWAPIGYERWDTTTYGLASKWRRVVKAPAGERELSRYEVGPDLIVNSPRRPWQDIGAANLNVVADHIAWCFKFDTTAAVRSCNLPAGASVGVGFAVDVRCNGLQFGVALVPNGSDVVGGLPAGATFTTLPMSRVSVQWDGAEWQVLGHRAADLGVWKPTHNSLLPSAHVWGNGMTIGNVGSGAGRANLDAWLLFQVFWSSLVDAESPMLTSAGAASSRGASAAADWAALKRLTVPDHRDRMSIGRATMGGAADAALISLFDTTVLGKKGGAEIHTHTGTIGPNSSSIPVNGGGGAAAGEPHDHPLTINAAAAIPPGIVSNVIYQLY